MSLMHGFSALPQSAVTFGYLDGVDYVHPARHVTPVVQRVRYLVSAYYKACIMPSPAVTRQ